MLNELFLLRVSALNVVLSDYDSFAVSSCSDHRDFPLTVYIIKRNGQREDMLLDKITSRIKKLCYGLDKKYIDPSSITLKVRVHPCPRLMHLTRFVSAGRSDNEPNHCSERELRLEYVLSGDTAQLMKIKIHLRLCARPSSPSILPTCSLILACFQIFTSDYSTR